MIPLKFVRAAKWAFALSLVITVTALAQRFAPELLKQLDGEEELQVVEIPAATTDAQRPAPAAPNLVGTNQGVESEPNGSFAIANPLGTNPEGKIKGNSLSGVLAAAGTDDDWYSFTTTVAGSKIYAATVTSFSGGGTDTVLELIGSDGATVLESDANDGTFGGNSSSIAGALLGSPGTYYLRVTNASTTAAITGYELYFAVRSGAPTAETEPNNNGAPQALPVSQWVSGAVTPAAPEDNDTFMFTANAGDTIFVSIDLDPERDTTTYNGRIGLGLFGTPSTFLVTGDAGTGDTIDSEAIVMTVETTGTYQVYTDSQTAGGGGPTAMYNFNVTTIPALPAGTCTTYTNSTPLMIPDISLASSTITIPDSKVIRSMKVVLDVSHIFFPDLDFHLRSPAGNDNGLVTDVGAASQTGAQNINLNDDAAIPALFAALNGSIFQPDLQYRLDWFRGENSLGTWTLDIRDDASPDGGTLNSWSLEVCEEPALTGTVIYNEDFEATNGSYTLGPGVTANEWEYGTPATVGTITSPPIAAFSNCASGTGCWKTDLDNTYEISSNQDLTSPAINLTGVSGPINLYWQARYQMESTSFDRIWVRVTEVGNPTNTRIVWHSTNATMRDDIGTTSSTILPASAGWGRYSGDISSFAGL
ncbi:MAG TPA: proprotein convertase P-domain-containing protein, partial [Chthoniobacterales bacterium]|nr:proprotein convertase P-domain-containing protein [Chthoniobacterales bacterium]